MCAAGVRKRSGKGAAGFESENVEESTGKTQHLRAGRAKEERKGRRKVQNIVLRSWGGDT